MPAPATGLVADWDPAAIVGLVDTDPAGTLEETVGNVDATSTGTNRPLYRTAGPNSKPYLEFDGTNDFLETVAMALAQPYHIFLVMRPRRWTSGNRPMDGQAASRTVLGQTPTDLAFGRGVQKYSIFAGSAFAPTNPGGAMTSTGGQFHYVRATYDGASSALSINGNTPVTGNPGSNSFTGICLGSAGDGSLSAMVDIVRVLLYNSSIASIPAVESYLITEYALVTPLLVLCDGDSLTEGSGFTNYPTQLLALLGSSWAVLETGVASETVVQMESDAATHIDPQLNTTSTHKIAVAWGGTNDLFASSATAYADYVTYCTNRRAAGWKVIALTALPRSAGGTPGGFEAARQAFNTSIRTNWATFADAFADVAANTNIGDAGDETNATYYAGDNVHLNTTGYAIVAALVKTAIDSLTATRRFLLARP